MHPCTILGRNYAPWEFEWIYETLTRVRKITKVMYEKPLYDTKGKRHIETWETNPQEHYKTVKRGTVSPSSDVLSVHPGEPPEILLEKISEMREQFFKNHPGLTKEMYGEWRDSRGRLIAEKYDFYSLDLSFKIFDMFDKQGMKYRKIINAFEKKKCQAGLNEVSMAKRVERVRSMIERSMKVNTLKDFLRPSNKAKSEF